ncbi:hypothetical protein ACOSQ2_013136 [Xanthoceras sorbifolium]
MAESKAFTIQTRKFMTNRLLSMKQFVIDVLHPMFQSFCLLVLCLILCPFIKSELKEKLQRMYDLKSESSTFVCIQNVNYEPKYRLIRNGLDTKVEMSRKQLMERKNRAKKILGVKKVIKNAAKGEKKK